MFVVLVFSWREINASKHRKGILPGPFLFKYLTIAFAARDRVYIGTVPNFVGHD